MASHRAAATGPGVARDHEALRGRERFRRAAFTSGVSAIGLVASVVTTLVTVPVLIRYLGPEPYGVWLTIAGATTWLMLAQVGLAPSLLNKLSAATGRGETSLARQIVSTAWWYQSAIAGVLALLVVPLYLLTPWAGVLNTTEPIAQVGQVVASIVWLGVIFGLPTTIASAVFRAFQEGYLASAWEVVRTIVRLGAVLLAVALDAGMAGIAVAWVLPQVAVGALAALHLFALRRPALRPGLGDINWEVGRSLLGTGIQFTGISVAGLIIWYTDNIVITQVLGPASVPRYAVAFSVIQLVISLEMMILDAAWPAYSEAAARGEVRWLVSAHRRFTAMVLAIAVAFAAALLIAGQPLLVWWAGSAAEPPDALVLVFAGLVVLQSVQLSYGRLLTALGAVRANMRLGFLNAAINLPLSIVLASMIGLPGVALGTLIGYALVGWFLVRRSSAEIRRVAAEARTGTDPMADSSGVET